MASALLGSGLERTAGRLGYALPDVMVEGLCLVLLYTLHDVHRMILRAASSMLRHQRCTANHRTYGSRYTAGGSLQFCGDTGISCLSRDRARSQLLPEVVFAGKHFHAAD